MAKAIVPPALIVSMPSSSQRLRGAQHGIADRSTPHSEPERKQTLVFERAPPFSSPIRRRCARSRWCRRRSWRAFASRATLSCSGEMLAAPSKRAALEVARRQRAEAD